MSAGIDEGPLPPRFAGARTGVVKPEPLHVTLDVGEQLGALIERLATPAASTPPNVRAATEAALVLDCGHRELLIAADSLCSLIYHRELSRLSEQSQLDLADLVPKLRAATKALGA